MNTSIMFHCYFSPGGKNEMVLCESRDLAELEAWVERHLAEYPEHVGHLVVAQTVVTVLGTR